MMSYLLAEYTLIFLMASIFSFVLGWLLSRRRYVDVTQWYQSSESQGQALVTNTNRIAERIGKLEATLVAADPAACRFDGNLNSIEDRLRAIEQQLNARESVKAEPISDSMPMAEPPSLSSVQPPSPAPEPSSEPISETVSAPVSASMQVPETAQSSGPLLFSSPVHGAKDDLKKISGVGPKLEGLLNENGVFYFWQVASWTAADIEFIDEQLAVFKGRIARDDWVSQAKALMREPGAANEPT